MTDVATFEGLRGATAGRWTRRPSRPGPWRGFTTDTRGDLEGAVFIALRGDRVDGHDFVRDAARGGAAVIVVDRPVSEDVGDCGVLQVPETRTALTQLARARRRNLAATRVIAITGSAGKTTTKRLVHAVLGTKLDGSAAPRSFNNDIGVPLTLLAAQPSDRYLVVEIGANAPGEVGTLAALAEPDVAVVTSIGRAHLGGFGSREILAREKLSLVTVLGPDGLAIVHVDAPRPFGQAPARVVTFGIDAAADLRLTGRGIAGSGRWWFEVNGQRRYELALPGRHNAVNALAAIAVGRRFGLDEDDIAQGLAAVGPDAMRLEPRMIGPVLVVNDAYNANPESVAAALETFGELSVGAERRIAVLGGMLELGDASAALHEEVADRLAEGDAADIVVLVGPECGPAFARLRSRWPMDRVAWIERTSDAPEAVAQQIRSGDAVLLKASRGHALERVEAEIERRLGPVADGPPAALGTRG